MSFSYHIGLRVEASPDAQVWNNVPPGFRVPTTSDIEEPEFARFSP